METKKIYGANDLLPFEPTHPGEILKEELQYRGVSQKKLADTIGMSYTALNEILNAKRSVSTETAMKIEAALGIEAHLWINLQADYNYHVARKDSSLMARLQQIRKIAAVL